MPEEPKMHDHNTCDFDYLCRAMNLLPYHSGAFNPSAIVAIDLDGKGNSADIEMYNGKVIGLTLSDLIKLETIIKQRIKERQDMEAEEIKRQAELRIQSELNAANQAMANAAMMGKLKDMKRTS